MELKESASGFMDQFRESISCVRCRVGGSVWTFVWQADKQEAEFDMAHKVEEVGEPSQ